MTEPAQPKPDVESQNIAVYERVFLKSLEAARKIEGKMFTAQDVKGDRTLQIGIAIFKQFFSDQGTITQAQKNAEAMVKGISGVMEGRQG